MKISNIIVNHTNTSTQKNVISSKFSYRWKLTLIILFFIAVPCLVFDIFIYIDTKPNWIKNALNAYYSDIENTSLFLADQLNELQSQMNYLSNNSTIQTLINRVEYLSLPLALDMITELENSVAAISATSPDLSVRWYPLRSTKSYGKYCYPLDFFTNEFSLSSNNTNKDTTEKTDDDILYDNIFQLMPGDTLWALRNISRNINNTGPSEMRLCLYTQLGHYSTPDCILELSIPIKDYFIFDSIENIPDSLFAFCIPQGGENKELLWGVVTNTVQSDQLLTQYQDTQAIPGYYIASSSIPNIDNGQVIFAFPYSYTVTLIRPQLTTFLLISVLIGLLLFYISYITARLLTRKYEIDTLRMELEILQLRFNPHLLYNTLNALCYQTRNPVIRDTISSLCNYYRVVLNNGYMIISIKKELEMIRDYLKIECFAYALEEVKVEFDIDEQILEHQVLKHILQPIVENALNHGIRPLKCGILRISVKKEENFITFEISDNGVGMTPEKIEELLKPPKYGTHGGYGIYNVEQRIRMYYGSQYGLQITSNKSIGTTVLLRLPSIEKK